MRPNAAYWHDIDRARLLTGAALVRHVYARDLGVAPTEVRLDRRCHACGRPHGRVRLADGQHSAVEVSVSHSGGWVVVAACRGHAVGVDVERLDPGIADRRVASLALGETELRQLTRLPPGERAAALTTYWTRKEAVVKAIGVGLAALFTDFEVSPPAAPAQLVAWPTRPDLPSRLRLHDLGRDSARRAALAVLDAPAQSLVDVAVDGSGVHVGPISDRVAAPGWPARRAVGPATAGRVTGPRWPTP